MLMLLEGLKPLEKTRPRHTARIQCKKTRRSWKLTEKDKSCWRKLQALEIDRLLLAFNKSGAQTSVLHYRLSRKVFIEAEVHLDEKGDKPISLGDTWNKNDDKKAPPLLNEQLRKTENRKQHMAVKANTDAMIMYYQNWTIRQRLLHSLGS